MQKISLTGDRPTGHLHLGHYAGSLINRLLLQETHDQFIMIADFQALTHNKIQDVNKNILAVMSDYLAVGLDPKKTTFFLQTNVSALHEIAAYYGNLVPMSRLTRNPTIKEELKNKDLTIQASPVSFIFHPISQAADITAFQADVVPIGADQKPLIEQTNEIVRSFRRIYDSTAIKEAEALYTQCPRLPGIDGKAKASKSLNNAILLTDSIEAVRAKVFAMYTDPNHIHVKDPGKVEGNVVFAYLDAFYANKDDLTAMKARYRQGGLGDVAIKQKLFGVLEELLEPMRARRKLYSQAEMIQFLKDGTQRANEIANMTLQRMKSDMGLFSVSSKDIDVESIDAKKQTFVDPNDLQREK